MSTFVIGDIHGGFKALVQLLAKAKVTSDDTLIFLGDLVDGWSESAQLIDYLIELSQHQSCIYVKGNHDALCEKWLKTGQIPDLSWTHHGGQATMDSYTNYSDERKAIHVQFFESMPMYHLTEKNQLFVHAGFTSMHGVDREFHQTDLFWDRTLWELALATDKKLSLDAISYPKRLKKYAEIYIGHTPTIDFESTTPMQAMNVWNLDTGAAFYGRLSCLNIDTKEFFQSDVVQNLYPNEKGRNSKKPTNTGFCD